MEPHWASAQFERAERLVQLVDREKEMIAKMRCTDFTDKWKKYDEDRTNRVRELERDLEVMKKHRDELVEKLALSKHQNLVNAAELKRQTDQNNHLVKRCNMIESVIERAERDRSGSKKGLRELRSEIDDVRVEVETLVAQLGKSTSTLQALRSQYIAEKSESAKLVASKDALIEQLRMESEAGKMREAKLRFDADCYNEKIGDLEQEIMKQRGKVEQLLLENGKINEETSALKSSLADTTAESDSLRQRLTSSEDGKAKVESAMREVESEKQNRIDAMDCEVRTLRIERNQLLAKIEACEIAKTDSEAAIGRLNHQLHEVQSQADGIQQQLSRAYASASVERESLNRRIAEVEDSRSGLQREVNAAQEIIAKALNDHEQAKARIAVLTEELHCGLKREEELKGRVSAIEKQCVDLRAKVAQANIDLHSEKDKAKEAEQLAASKIALEKENTWLRLDLAMAKSDLDAASTHLEVTKTDLKAAKVELEAAKTDLQSAKTELETAKKDLAMVKTDLETAKKNLEANEADLEAAKTDFEVVKTHLEVAKTDLDAANTDLEGALANAAKVLADSAVTEKLKDQEIERLKAECDRMMETMDEFEKQSGILRADYVKLQRENSQLKHLVQEQQVAIGALNRAQPKSTPVAQKVHKSGIGINASPKRASGSGSSALANTPNVPVQRCVPTAPRAKPKLDATFDEEESDKQTFLFREQHPQLFAERLSPKRKSTNIPAATVKRSRI